MKFRLKTLLITLCGLGATVGMLGNLLIRNPETFLAVVQFGSTIVPYVLATGTIIWLGFRQGYRRDLIAWGTLLLLAPVVVNVALAVAWPSRDPLQVLSTQRLIETRLPPKINEPWVWRELERRLAAGNLTQAEVSAALRQLVTMMSSASPKGYNQPLHWQRDFVRKAKQANMIPTELQVELCDAFFGTLPTPGGTRPITDKTRRVNLSMNYGSTWSDHLGLDVQLLWQVTNVALDGAPMTMRQPQRFDENWQCSFEGPFLPGEHEAVLTVECAYVDTRLLPGIQAASLPVATWPQAIKRWTTTVNVPIKVESSDGPAAAERK